MNDMLAETTNIYSVLVTGAVFIITLVILRMILKGPGFKGSGDKAEKSDD